MKKYENSRDLTTALLDSLQKLFNVVKRCIQEGLCEIKKIFCLFYSDLKSGSWTLRTGSVVAIMLILVPSLFQWKDNLVSATEWWNRDELARRYAKLVVSEDKIEVYEFFQKYHERFMNRDCEWMAEVAADRAMYEKYGNTKFDNYNCEEFIKTEAKWYLPYRIGDPVLEDEIIRIEGEAVMLLERMEEGTLLLPVKFEIWKRYDWDIWHFSKKPVKITASIIAS